MKRLTLIFIFLFNSFNSLVHAEDSDPQEKKGKRSFAEIIEPDPSLPIASPLDIKESPSGIDDVELQPLVEENLQDELSLTQIEGKVKGLGRFQYAALVGAEGSIRNNQFGYFNFFISAIRNPMLLNWLLRYAAVKAEDPKFIEALLSRPGVNVNMIFTGRSLSHMPTALHAAIIKGKFNNAKALLDAGADPNRPQQKPALHSAVENVNFDAVALLVNHPKTDMNAKESYFGRTALHTWVETDFASHQDMKLMGHLLLSEEKTVDLRARDTNENTALDLAIARPEKMKFLLDAGADPNAKNANGERTIHRIAIQSQIYEEDRLVQSLNELLSSEYVSPDVQDSKLKVGPLALSLESGEQIFSPYPVLRTNPNLQDAEGRTALHIAASKNLTVTEALLANDEVDHTKKDNQGRTIMHYAVQLNSEDLAKLLKNKKMRDLINMPDNQGNTPLHKIAKIGYTRDVLEKIEILVTAGADVNSEAESSDGRTITPLEILYERGESISHDGDISNIRKAAVILLKEGAKVSEHINISPFLFGTEISELVGEDRLEWALEKATGCYNFP